MSAPTTLSFSKCRKILLILCASVSLLILTNGHVQAQPPSASVKLVRRGVELRTRGRDKRALELFRRAYELDASPVALAQMAEAEHALNFLSEAEEHLPVALESKDPWVEGHRAELTRSLETIRRKRASRTLPPVVLSQKAAEPAQPSGPTREQIVALHDATLRVEAVSAALESANRQLVSLEQGQGLSPVLSAERTARMRAALADLGARFDGCIATLAAIDLHASTPAPKVSSTSPVSMPSY